MEPRKMFHIRTFIRKDIKDELKGTFILLMCLAYLLHFFIDSAISLYTTFVMCLIVFLICIKESNSLPRYFSITMLGLGLWLNISEGSLYGIVTGLQSNLPLLSLIVLVPMLSIPLKSEGYFQSVQHYLEKWSSDNRKIFGSISVFLFFLGPILNLGSIRILHETIKDFKSEPILLAKSYLVGFSTVILWSPYFASVAMVLHYLHVPLLDYLPLGLGLAVTQLIIGNLLFWLWLNKKKPGNLLPARDVFDSDLSGHHKRKMYHLLWLIAFLMVIIFSTEHMTMWPMMFIVSILSVLFPLSWAAARRKKSECLHSFHEYRTIVVPRMNNEVVLFLSAGLFAQSLAGTLIADKIKLFMINIAGVSFLLFSITVIFSILILTFIGIHQIVIVTVLATQMNPEMLGTAPEVLALLLMVSWSMSSVLSPANPLNLIVSNAVKQSGFAVGFKWNGFYLLSMLICGTVFIYLIH
jgi:hypothetical protein